MENKDFVKYFYRYLDRNTQNKNKELQQFFLAIPDGVNLTQIQDALLKELQAEKTLIDTDWSVQEIPWNLFDRMAYRYQHLQRKEWSAGLSPAEKRERDSLFNKMYSTLLKYYHEKELEERIHSASIDVEDFDSVIALTLVKCLTIHDLTENEILTRLNLSEKGAARILFNEFGIVSDFWFSAKEALFIILSRKDGYASRIPYPYIVNGKTYYPLEIYTEFYEDVAKLAKKNNVSFSIPKSFGFNRNKSEKFYYYVKGAIYLELNKLFKGQFSVHFPMRSSVPQELFDMVSMDEKGVYQTNDSYFDLVDKTYQQNDFFAKVYNIKNGNLLLYYCGVDFSNEGFTVSEKRTFADTAEHFGLNIGTTKNRVKKCACDFRKKYPDFLSYYVF